MRARAGVAWHNQERCMRAGAETLGREGACPRRGEAEREVEDDLCARGPRVSGDSESVRRDRVPTARLVADGCD